MVVTYDDGVLKIAVENVKLHEFNNIKLKLATVLSADNGRAIEIEDALSGESLLVKCIHANSGYSYVWSVWTKQDNFDHNGVQFNIQNTNQVVYEAIINNKFEPNEQGRIHIEGDSWF